MGAELRAGRGWPARPLGGRTACSRFGKAHSSPGSAGVGSQSGRGEASRRRPRGAGSPGCAAGTGMHPGKGGGGLRRRLSLDRGKELGGGAPGPQRLHDPAGSGWPIPRGPCPQPTGSCREAKTGRGARTDRTPRSHDRPALRFIAGHPGEARRTGTQRREGKCGHGHADVTSRWQGDFV